MGKKNILYVFISGRLEKINLPDNEYAKEFFKRVVYTNISLYDYKDLEGRQKLMGWWKDYLTKLNIPTQRYRLVGEYFNFGNNIFNGSFPKGTQHRTFIPALFAKKKNPTSVAR